MVFSNKSQNFLRTYEDHEIRLFHEKFNTESFLKLLLISQLTEFESRMHLVIPF